MRGATGGKVEMVSTRSTVRVFLSFCAVLYRFMLFSYRFMLFFYRFMLFSYRFMLFSYRFVRVLVLKLIDLQGERGDGAEGGQFSMEDS